LVVAVAACDKTPTGRRQLTLIPESQIERLGVQTFARIKRTQPMEVSPQINALVRCVAKTIIDMLPNQQSPWEVVVFRDAQPNAFVLPGGKIGINTGILRVTENPAQLATIIGHEVAHVLADHANERMTQELGIQAIFYLLQQFFTPILIVTMPPQRLRRTSISGAVYSSRCISRSGTTA